MLLNEAAMHDERVRLKLCVGLCAFCHFFSKIYFEKRSLVSMRVAQGAVKLVEPEAEFFKLVPLFVLKQLTNVEASNRVYTPQLF
jgi:hypothetical protein